MYYFKVKHSAQKLETLQTLKDNNDTKLKALNESLNCYEVTTEINIIKQEKYK